MYEIAICEDEDYFAGFLEKNCHIICQKSRIEHSIKVFKNSETFLDSFSKNPQSFELLLLDIIMGEMDGIELARTIRQKNRDIRIIFITANRDFALSGYEVRALHFMLKPVNLELLEELIIEDYKSRFERKFITVESGTDIIKVNMADIIGLETQGRKVAIYLYTRILHKTAKISDILEKLPQAKFVRCHHSYAINIENILEITKTRAIGINGMEFPISRRFAKHVQKEFLENMDR